VSDEGETRRRALAVLRALATGDALGAACEGYAADEVLAIYEASVTELVEPVNLYPESAPDRERGAVGPVTHGALAGARLLELGPEAAWPARITPLLSWAVPLGMSYPLIEAPIMTRRAAGIARLSEAGSLAGSAACALASAISAGLDLYLARDVFGAAIQTAGDTGAPALAQRLAAAAGEAQASGGRGVGRAVARVCPPGPDPVDAAVFAFGVAFGAQSVRRAIIEAANEGGAASLTAGLAGALCAAFAPASSVEAWADEVEAISALDLRAVAGGLLTLRFLPPAPEPDP